MPFSGGCCAPAAEAVVALFVDVDEDEVEDFDELDVDGVDVVGVVGGVVAVLPLVAVPVPTVSIGAILSSWFFSMPALDKSATAAYGRPAMIFFAVAAPMPGTASSSACVAVLMFTGDVGATFFPELFDVSFCADEVAGGCAA